MDMESFLLLARKYVDLGWSVQAQLVQLDENEECAEELNPNALALIAEFLEFASQHNLLGTDRLLHAIKQAKFEDA